MLSAIVLVAASISLALTGHRAVANEQGVVEAMSAIVLAATLAFFAMRRDKASPNGSGLILLGFLAARECDLDKMTFQHGIFSLKQFSGTAPIVQKIVALTIALIILYAFCAVVWRNFRPWLRDVLHGRSWALFMLVALLLVTIGKTLDGAGRKLASVGIEVTVSAIDLAQLIEESAELAAALCLMQAVVRLPLRRAAVKGDARGRTHADRSPRPDHLDGAGARGPQKHPV